MPGVLIIEAMAQTGGVLLLNGVENPGEKLAMFTSINNAKFRRPVVPGDQLVMEVTMQTRRSRIALMNAKAFVDGKPARLDPTEGGAEAGYPQTGQGRPRGFPPTPGRGRWGGSNRGLCRPFAVIEEGVTIRSSTYRFPRTVASGSRIGGMPIHHGRSSHHGT
jgi:hypothetical protein